jgi:hypothetical protein
MGRQAAWPLENKGKSQTIQPYNQNHWFLIQAFRTPHLTYTNMQDKPQFILLVRPGGSWFKSLATARYRLLFLGQTLRFRFQSMDYTASVLLVLSSSRVHLGPGAKVTDSKFNLHCPNSEF